MIRPRDRTLAAQIDAGLIAFDRSKRHLPGIHKAESRRALEEQLLESIHRVKFVEVMRGREISARRADPADELFDPLKAAILDQRAGETEEAFWLVFLFVHFGKHARGGWRYVREIYGRFGEGGKWDWQTTSADPAAFRAWLSANNERLRRPGAQGGFGNHRKRESLDADSDKGTGAVIESYVKWINPPRTHQRMIAEAAESAGNDPQKMFEYLYYSMEAVIRFGRLARFDYLTMLGKLGLANIAPGSPYLQGSSGPRKGASRLFGNTGSAEELDKLVIDLDSQLHVGMQVLEDALCNWQKSPDKFVAFRG
jgi:alpha-glutamyl/putrescinyl thymine pyrophosphorylase-like protein